MVHQFIAHHIHVALQDNDFAIFEARSGWLADNYVACFIDFSLQVVAFAKLFQILNHLLLVL